MADITSVIQKIRDALVEAQTVAGVQTDAQVIAALQTQIDTLTAANTAQAAEIVLVKADLTAIQVALDKAKTDAV